MASVCLGEWYPLWWHGGEGLVWLAWNQLATFLHSDRCDLPEAAGATALTTEDWWWETYGELAHRLAVRHPRGGWSQQFGALTRGRFEELLWDAETVLGLVPGQWVREAVIDIDPTSSLHPVQAGSEQPLRELVQLLRETGLEPVVIYSSARDGIHIRLPLPEQIQPNRLGHTLRALLEEEGYALAPGQLEVFPTPRQSYAPHGEARDWAQQSVCRLAAQPGCRDFATGMAIAPADWPSRFEMAAAEVDWPRFTRRIEAQVAAYRSQRPAARTVQLSLTRRDGTQLTPEGLAKLATKQGLVWSGYGQSNGLIGQLVSLAQRLTSIEDATLLGDLVASALPMVPGYAQYASAQTQTDVQRPRSGWCHRWAATAIRRAGSLTYVTGEGPSNEERAADALQRFLTALKAAMAQTWGVRQLTKLRQFLSDKGAGGKSLRRWASWWRWLVTGEAIPAELQQLLETTSTTAEVQAVEKVCTTPITGGGCGGSVGSETLLLRGSEVRNGSISAVKHPSVRRRVTEMTLPQPQPLPKDDWAAVRVSPEDVDLVPSSPCGHALQRPDRPKLRKSEVEVLRDAVADPTELTGQVPVQQPGLRLNPEDVTHLVVTGVAWEWDFQTRELNPEPIPDNAETLLREMGQLRFHPEQFCWTRYRNRWVLLLWSAAHEIQFRVRGDASKASQ